MDTFQENLGEDISHEIGQSSLGVPKFSSPEEEIAFLREEIRKKEETLGRFAEHLGEGVSNGVEKERDRLAKEEVERYARIPKEEALADEYRMPGQEAEEIVLKLSPESHDRQMEELLGVVTERGIMNALSVVQEMNNPHLEDDFHRLLVQYVRAAEKENPEIKKTDWLFRALRMTLFEVILPVGEKEEKEKSLKDLIAGMEHFYAGMMSVDTDTSRRADRNYFALEIALPHTGDEVSFFAAVPDEKQGLFEKQVLAMFPNAKVRENTDDYNIFNMDGVSVGAYAEASKNAVFPIKIAEEFHEDPLSVIINAFSKLTREGEGAAIQFLVSPVGEKYNTLYRGALRKVKDGEPLAEAIDVDDALMPTIVRGGKNFLGAVFREGFGALGQLAGGSSGEDAAREAERKKQRKEEEKQKNRMQNEEAIKKMEMKISSPILATNIRVVASAANRARAEEILESMESSFHQFTDTQGSGITFKKLEKTKLDRMLYDFSFRLFSPDHSFPLNIKELATVCHFPTAKIAQHVLKKARSGATAPAPADMPESGAGVVLGVNEYRSDKKKIRFSKEDRVRHFYVIGQTGTGKSVLLRNMIIQDIRNGEGVCYIDPHGSDIEDILANIPPERADDVIYFDPSSMPRPMGLNMLEFDARFPEQKTFVVNELLSIFNKLFDMKIAGGPAFEQYFRNASLLVMEHPESGNTLLEIGRVMGDKAFRDMKLAFCKNPIIKQFWQNAEKTTGDQSLANFVPYITNKFDVFITNDIMRPIIAQEKSAFNFREIMDHRKIFLVNLSKGRLGDINSHLIGLILVGKILMASLSRVDILGKGTLPPDFYLYIDEFQNITTDSISTILSEARKYRLSLNMAHQFIAQLDESIRDSVFGNVGSMAVFRVGAEDAEFLEKQFEPVFSANDIIKIENYNAYVKMLIGGVPAKPFNMSVLPPEKGNPAIAEQIKELSRLKFGRDREEIEAEIMAKYHANPRNTPASTTNPYTPQNG